MYAYSDDETSADDEDSSNHLAFEVEPGVDVQRSDFSDLYDRDHLSITVADWCSRKSKVREDLDNPQFLHWLDAPRPSWSKGRWINLNGLNWDVFKAIAIKVSGRANERAKERSERSERNEAKRSEFCEFREF